MSTTSLAADVRNEAKPLACMEVWGGNQATFAAFEKAGLDIWLYSRPCGTDASGGDLYYLSSCASGRITRMLVADVAGHGEAVAELASGLRGLMRQYINTIRPQKLFEDVNREFTRLSTVDRFATSVLSSYFMPTSTLSICNAGHPMPLLCRSSAGRWDSLELPENACLADMPFGVDEVSAYTKFDINVRAGDMVLCFTDGLIESKNAGGEQLGTAGLLTALNSLRLEQPDRIIPILVGEIVERSDHSLPEDDLTILLFRISNRAIPLRDNLAAPWRWLKGVFSKPLK